MAMVVKYGGSRGVATRNDTCACLLLVEGKKGALSVSIKILKDVFHILADSSIY